MLKKTIIGLMHEYSRLVHNYLPNQRSIYDKDDKRICGFGIGSIEYSDIGEMISEIKNNILY